MSFTQNDRNFRSESGKTFPGGAGDGARPRFASVIAAGLKQDFGDTPAAVKTVARLVGANDRAVRNWFEGANGPSGEHLVMLMNHSSAVTRTVLRLAGRADLVQTTLVADARDRVRQILTLLDGLTQR